MRDTDNDTIVNWDNEHHQEYWYEDGVLYLHHRKLSKKTMMGLDEAAAKFWELINKNKTGITPQ